MDSSFELEQRKREKLNTCVLSFSAVCCLYQSIYETPRVGMSLFPHGIDCSLKELLPCPFGNHLVFVQYKQRWKHLSIFTR